jgi:hypothetical protein
MQASAAPSPFHSHADPEVAGPAPGGAAAAVSAVAARAPADPVSLTGLPACIEDARVAAQLPVGGPPDPTFFGSLQERMRWAVPRLPAPYRAAVGEPLLRALDGMGPGGFARVLARDPGRTGPARLLLDAAQAVLQRTEGYQARATAAFQEVVSDLYDGFLSAEDRRGVKPPDHGVLAPLVRWGSAGAGPYTWPASVTDTLGIGTALVSLPAGNARAGLLAWPALAHETAGHDILSADEGLRGELARAVRRELAAARLPAGVAAYWSDRIDEAASDVMGVLNMGPAAAVGLVGYFRALNGAFRGVPALRTAGRPEDPHPADVARAWLAAETVRLCSFRGAGRWADRLAAEADRDAGRIRLGDVEVTPEVARASAAAVARAVARTRLGALEGRALSEIEDWSDRDEAIVASLRRGLADGGAAGPGERPGGTRPLAGAWAAHAVAAGVYEAVSGGTSPARVQERMVDLLARMHRRNPSFT